MHCPFLNVTYLFVKLATITVVLYSFGMDFNITYSTKHKNSKYSGIYEVSK